MRKLDINKIGIDSNSSVDENKREIERIKLFKNLKKNNLSISDIAALLSSRLDLTRVLYYNNIYQHIPKTRCYNGIWCSLWSYIVLITKTKSYL